MVSARKLVAVGVVALALVGCTSRAPSPTPPPSSTPSPTYLCTPDPAAGGVPCSPEQYSEELRLNILYDEATKNYHRYVAENGKLLRAGGAEKASANLLAVAGGPFLDATVTNLRQLRELGVKAGPGDFKVTRVDRSPGAPTRGYEVALATCVDGRGVALLQGDAVLKQGSLVAQTVFFKRDGGVLKLWDAEARPVESC